MAIAHVQSKSGGGSTGATTAVVNSDNSCTAGNLIVISVGHTNSVNTDSITDDRGSTYTQIGSTYNDTTNSQKGSLWYGILASGSGTVSFTANLSGSGTYRNITFSEYSGAHSSPLDQSYTPTTPSTTSTGTDGTKTASSITPSQNNCLIYAMFQDTSGSISISAGTGFTQRDSSATIPQQVEDFVQGSAAAVFGTWTVGTAGHNYQAVVASFKQAAPGGTDVMVPMGMLGTRRV